MCIILVDIPTPPPRDTIIIPIIIFRGKEERTIMPKEFQKAKPPTFDRDMKKLEEAEAWLLSMEKLLRINDYFENMQAKIGTYSLKGKENNGGKELTWCEFERLSISQYLSKRYYDNKAK